MELREYIHVTSIVDGKRAAIRAANISAVYENDGEKQKYGGYKPPFTTIDYDGNGSVDVAESFDEVCDMIYRAEL